MGRPRGLKMKIEYQNVKAFLTDSGDYQPSTWVKLNEIPHQMSFDEALLLCQESDQQWWVWIPDFGQVLLPTSQFS